MSDRLTIVSVRLGFLASLIFAIFWCVWHLLGHRVPNYLWLPISRWWDVPAAFFTVIFYSWFWRKLFSNLHKIAHSEYVGYSGAYSAIISIICGAVAGIIFGLGIALVSMPIFFGAFWGFFVGVELLFSTAFWKKIINWFLVK